MNPKTQFLSRAAASPVSRSLDVPSVAPFARRYTTAAAVRARFPTPPLGRLIDPFLLDRLHAPLTRFRD